MLTYAGFIFRIIFVALFRLNVLIEVAKHWIDSPILSADLYCE